MRARWIRDIRTAFERNRCVERGIEETPVSLGYGRIRFVKPVFIGDTVTVAYTIATIVTRNAEQLRKLKSAISEAKWWQSAITF